MNEFPIFHENEALIAGQAFLSRDEFNELLRTKPGLLILSQKSWSEPIGEEIRVYLKFMKKNRIYHALSYFPRNFFFVTKIGLNPIVCDWKERDSELAKEIISVHAEYENLKFLEEQDALGEGFFYSGVLSKNEFNMIISSFAGLLILKTASWSQKNVNGTFSVHLEFFEDFVLEDHPITYFGEELIEKFNQVDHIDTPPNYEPNGDILRMVIKNAFDFYMEHKNRKIGRPRLQGTQLHQEV